MPPAASAGPPSGYGSSPATWRSATVGEGGIDEGADPWSELIATRNVYTHYTPSAISYDRVWADTLADTPRLLGAVSAEQQRQ